MRQLGLPVKLARTPGEHARLPGPALGEHTEEVLLAAGYSEARGGRAAGVGCGGGPGAGEQWTPAGAALPSVSPSASAMSAAASPRPAMPRRRARC